MKNSLIFHSFTQLKRNLSQASNALLVFVIDLMNMILLFTSLFCSTEMFKCRHLDFV